MVARDTRREPSRSKSTGELQVFPPSQRAASFTIDQTMEKLEQGFGKYVPDGSSTGEAMAIDRYSRPP
jgi:hypothetical protein